MQAISDAQCGKNGDEICGGYGLGRHLHLLVVAQRRRRPIIYITTHPIIAHASDHKAINLVHNYVICYDVSGCLIGAVMKTSKSPKRHRGRPPIGDENMEQIAIRLPRQILDDVDSFTAGSVSRTPRSVTIRQLLEEAIEARMQKGKKR